MEMVALVRGVTLLGAKVPSPSDPTTNFYSGRNKPIRLVRADMFNWSVETAINVSCGFESQAESFFLKILETMDTLFECGFYSGSK